AGTFQMGSPPNEEFRRDDETLHEVTLTRPFFMARFPVTQEQYERPTGSKPSFFSVAGNPAERTPPLPPPGAPITPLAAGGGKDWVREHATRRFPVENTSWDDAQAFCSSLARRTG